MFIKRVYKKCIIYLAAALFILAGQTSYARGIYINVNGDPLEETSLVRNGATYVPLAPLLESLGGWEARWNSRERTVTAETDLFTLTVPIGEDYVTADGHLFGLSGDCIIVDGRTYVPLRSIANLLGADVAFTGWDSPITVDSASTFPFTEEDLYWLSRVISAESRGESLYGQIAVGNVVLNRVRSREFPNTIKAVVFDTKNAVQFEPTANGTIYDPPTEKSILAARLALQGTDSVGECMYFFNPTLSEGKWIRENRPYFTTIGCHRFYF